MTRIQRIKNTLKKITTPTHVAPAECAPRISFKRSAYRTAGLLVIVLFSFFVLPKVGFAQSTDTAPDTAQTIIQNIGAVMTVGFGFLQFLLYPLTMLIAQLMDPDILIGPDMEAKLLSIWVIFRNWVNIFFVLILVGIALYNVLGIAGDGSNYALKAILPKIVIGLIAVNFSFLAGKVLIDATNVLTNAVYALPTDLGTWDDQVTGVKKRICQITEMKDVNGDKVMDTEVYFSRKVDDGGVMTALFCACNGTDGSCSKDKSATKYTGEFNSLGTSFFKVFGANNVSLILMVNMGQVSDIDIVNLTENKSTADQAASLTMQMLFGILMFLLFGFAYVAVVVVLAARLVVLWICLALSPFIVIFFIFPDIGSFAGGEFDFKTQFFKHLFAPLVMGLVFSVGFVMLAVLQNSSSGGWLGQIGSITFSQLGDSGQVSKLMDAYGKDISDFGDLLIAVCAVVIIWVGVFAAASQTIASSWTNAIKGAGQSFGKFIAESPLYATMIPIPGKKNNDGTDMKVGLGNLLGAIPQWASGIEQKRREKTQAVLDDVLGGRSSLQKYADNVMGEVRTATNFRDARGHLRTLAETKGFESLHWAKMLNEDGAKLELETYLTSPNKEKFLEAMKKGDDRAVLDLIKTDSKVREAVLGEGTVAFGHNDVPADTSKETSPAQGETDQSKAKQREGQDNKVKKAEVALSTAAAGTAGTTLGNLKTGQTEVMEALETAQEIAIQAKAAGATSADQDQLKATLNGLFDDPDMPELEQAVRQNKLTANTVEYKGLKVNDQGKLSSAGFIKAVTGKDPAPHAAIIEQQPAVPENPGKAAVPSSMSAPATNQSPTAAPTEILPAPAPAAPAPAPTQPSNSPEPPKK